MSAGEQIFINGLGAAVPHRMMSNEAFALLTRLDPQWIEQRCGVQRRYMCRSTRAARQLALSAARDALAQAKVDLGDIGLVVVAAAHAIDQPPVISSSHLRRDLGLPRATMIDITTPRTGFAEGLSIACERLRRRGAGCALVIGAEGRLAAGSLRDRRTCYGHSDGAGAMVISHRPGMARLAPPLTGRAELQAVNVSIDESRATSLLCSPGQANTLTAVSDALLQAKSLATASRIITQELRSNAEHLPKDAFLSNPFCGTGFFGSASLPLCLYRLLCNQQFNVGEEALLFASDGLGGWTALPLQIEVVPSFPVSIPLCEDPQTAPVERKLRLAATPGELERELVKLSQDPGASWGHLACVALKITMDNVDSDVVARIGQEARAILHASTRTYDEIIQLEGVASFALLLRNLVDLDDARRLGQRLSILLEDLDLAGEIELKVGVETVGIDLHNPAQGLRRIAAMLAG